MPESSDSDFTWDSFYKSNNNELVATFGNFVNRIESLLRNNFDNKVPKPIDLNENDKRMIESIKGTFKVTHKYIYARQFRNALKSIMALAQDGNKYVDYNAPWKEIKTDKQRAATTLWVAINVVSNLGVLISPFLPKTSTKISQLHSQKDDLLWQFREIMPETMSNTQGPLFKKIDLAEKQKNI
jgi:methionyl-tRNA synthetase